MKGPIGEVDAQRARWCRYRQRLCLTTDADDFADGGLGSHVGDLDVRVLLLPSDPDANTVTLDEEVLQWLKQDRPTPYGGGSLHWGSRSRATSSALVVYDSQSDAKEWTRYLALHRHGGLELARGDITFDLRETRIFSLRHIVGLTWCALDMQTEVNERWQSTPPYELTVSLRNTLGATLGSSAEGWKQPGRDTFDYARCIEDHVLLRWELHADFDPAHVGLEVGDRLEQAFGTTYRRHLAHRGEYEGKFDPRFGF